MSEIAVIITLFVVFVIGIIWSALVERWLRNLEEDDERDLIEEDVECPWCKNSIRISPITPQNLEFHCPKCFNRIVMWRDPSRLQKCSGATAWTRIARLDNRVTELERQVQLLKTRGRESATESPGGKAGDYHEA